jgi:pimeloyl-ACP methyl ester carboxylesterase
MKTFLYDENIEIKYQEDGEGDPIIFLHGFGGSSYSWRYIYKEFANKYKAILIDLKGFGLSDKPTDNKYSVNDQADIINSFIQSNQFNNIILVGHSFGGAVALLTYFGSKNKNKIKKLILIDSGGYNQSIPWYIDSLNIPIVNILALSLVPSRFWVKVVLKMCFYNTSKISEDMIETYASYLRLPGAHSALIKTTGQLIPDNIDEITSAFNKIGVPVLLIWGDSDKVIPLSVGNKMHENITNSELVVIRNCGHNVTCPQ